MARGKGDWGLGGSGNEDTCYSVHNKKKTLPYWACSIVTFVPSPHPAATFVNTAPLRNPEWAGTLKCPLFHHLCQGVAFSKHRECPPSGHSFFPWLLCDHSLLVFPPLTLATLPLSFAKIAHLLPWTRQEAAFLVYSKDPVTWATLARASPCQCSWRNKREAPCSREDSQAQEETRILRSDVR